MLLTRNKKLKLFCTLGKDRELVYFYGKTEVAITFDKSFTYLAIYRTVDKQMPQSFIQIDKTLHVKNQVSLNKLSTYYIHKLN